MELYSTESNIKRKNENIIKIVLVIACFILFFIWSVAQPYNSCPDERMRYDIATYIFDNNTLPIEGDSTLRDGNYGFSYATTPPLPYVISTLFMKIVSIFSSSAFTLLMAARMTSILSGVGFVILSIKIAELLFLKNNVAKWCFILLCAFWPQVVFLFTYVNCDSLMLFSVALLVYCLLRGIKNHWNIKSCIASGIAASMCALTYYNTLGMIICAVFVFVASNIQQKNPLKEVIKKMGIISLVIFLLTGWFFIRNGILYHGDIFGMAITKYYGELYGGTNFTPSVRSARSVAMMLSLPGIQYWLVLSAKSFIGFFGHMDIPLKIWMYWIFYTIVIIACCGTVIGTYKKIKNRSLINDKFIFAIGMLIGAITTFIISIYFSFSDFQPQGRYLMPAFLGVAWFLAAGLSEIDKCTKKYHIHVVPILAIFLIAVIVCCYLQIICVSY